MIRLIPYKVFFTIVIRIMPKSMCLHSFHYTFQYTLFLFVIIRSLQLQINIYVLNKTCELVVLPNQPIVRIFPVKNSWPYLDMPSAVGLGTYICGSQISVSKRIPRFTCIFVFLFSGSVYSYQRNKQISVPSHIYCSFNILPYITSWHPSIFFFLFVPVLFTSYIAYRFYFNPIVSWRIIFCWTSHSIISAIFHFNWSPCRDLCHNIIIRLCTSCTSYWEVVCTRYYKIPYIMYLISPPFFRSFCRVIRQSARGNFKSCVICTRLAFRQAYIVYRSLRA